LINWILKKRNWIIKENRKKMMNQEMKFPLSQTSASRNKKVKTATKERIRKKTLSTPILKKSRGNMSVIMKMSNLPIFTINSRIMRGILTITINSKIIGGKTIIIITGSLSVIIRIERIMTNIMTINAITMSRRISTKRLISETQLNPVKTIINQIKFKEFNISRGSQFMRLITIVILSKAWTALTVNLMK
jgi:hypothetical protein